MWFERFLQLIDRSPIGAVVERRRRLLEYTGEPARIYVENVRAFFGVSHGVAKLMCELGVRQGLFERCEAFMCPHDARVIFERCDEEVAAPASLPCEVCEALEIEPRAFAPAECRVVPFYRLAHDDAA